MSSTLTGVYPWGRHGVPERISVWGVAGYGEGTLTLTPKSDVMGVRTTMADVPGLSAAEAEVTRLWLGVEGSWSVRLAGGGTLMPVLEIGVRHDGGDAETGFGADIGFGITCWDPQRGLSADVRTRGLLSHEAGGFRERGVSGTLAFDPTPSSARGPRLALTQTVGVSSVGGMEALLGRGTLTGLAVEDDGDGSGMHRSELTLGYGLAALGGRFTATPEVGVGVWNGGRDYRLGWRRARGAWHGDGLEAALEVALEAARWESDIAAPGSDAAEHTVGVRVTARY